MKIAIPMEEKSMSSSICVTFGRAPYFLTFDTDTENEIYIENQAVAAQGGAGIKAEIGSVKHNIELLKNRKLVKLTEFHSGFHGHGGR